MPQGTMNSSTINPLLAALSSGANEPVSLFKLVQVELRKMFNTRSGRWFAAGLMLLCVLAAAMPAINGQTDGLGLARYMNIVFFPLGFLLPILAILLVTSEWTQRGALTTFALTPNRKLVTLAKLLAIALVFGVASVAAISLSALATLIFATGDQPHWQVPSYVFFGHPLVLALNVLMGTAVAMLVAQTTAAIVIYLVVPTFVWAASAEIGSSSNPIKWLDFNTTMTQVTDGRVDTAHLLIVSAIWVAIPLVAGLYLQSKREVK